MIRKRWKRGGALFLALALLLSGTGILKTRAAVAVDVDADDCTLTVDVSELYTLVENGEPGEWTNPPEDMYETDLPDMQSQVTVNLYKVASIDSAGRYTAIDPFSSLKSSLEAVDSETNAAEWNEMAVTALGFVTDADGELMTPEDGLGKGVTPETKVIEFTGLEVGLYLVAAAPVETNYYTYNFSPYLVSLPDNEYDAEVEGSSDDWIYNVAMGLKVEQTPRYGDLNIVKTLTDMNTTFGSSTTFVYQIDITTLKGERETRIEAIEFTGAGRDTLTVSDIEAGSTVRVTELYSGAGYKISGSDTAGAVIVADGLEGASAQVEFTNVPDNTMTGGYGAINHFEQDADGTDYIHKRLDGGAVNAPAE